MKHNDPNPPSREAWEERITALLLGELGADETETVRQAMASDAELATFHRRMERTLALVREACPAGAQALAPTAGTAPARLSEDRRQALLDHLKKPPQKPSPAQRIPRGIAWHQLWAWRWTIPWAAAACLVAFLGSKLVVMSLYEKRMQLAKMHSYAGAQAPPAAVPAPQLEPFGVLPGNAPALTGEGESRPGLRLSDDLGRPMGPTAGSTAVPSRPEGEKANHALWSLEMKPHDVAFLYSDFTSTKPKAESAPAPESAKERPAPGVTLWDTSSGTVVAEGTAAGRDAAWGRSLGTLSASTEAKAPVPNVYLPPVASRESGPEPLAPTDHPPRLLLPDWEPGGSPASGTRIAQSAGKASAVEEKAPAFTGLPIAKVTTQSGISQTVVLAQKSLGARNGSQLTDEQSLEPQDKKSPPVAPATPPPPTATTPPAWRDNGVALEIQLEPPVAAPESSAAGLGGGATVKFPRLRSIVGTKETVAQGDSDRDSLQREGRVITNVLADFFDRNNATFGGGGGVLSSRAVGFFGVPAEEAKEKLSERGRLTGQERAQPEELKRRGDQAVKAEEKVRDRLDLYFPQGLANKPIAVNDTTPATEAPADQPVEIPSSEQGIAQVQTAPTLANEPPVATAAAAVPAKSLAEKPAPSPAPARPTAEPMPEVLTALNPFSTFSLNVSDVAFRLAAASLESGQLPEPGSIRSEEFVNAFDYHDPAPRAGEKLAFAWDQAHSPFAHNRDVVRFSIQTAALGREPGRALNLVLLLDNSGSMERADRVRILREALAVLARQLTQADRVSVVAFARTPRLWVDGLAGGDPEALLEQVGNLNPEGGTNLELALGLGYATAEKHFLPKGNNRLILLTDGAANLGNVDPASLKQTVEGFRRKGIALDCFGVGWEGYNDDLLEILARNGDGRYSFINDPAQASTDFADQLAGALRVAAANVKAQVEFNPDRVLAYRQIGYEKHQLTKEQFRDDTVDAAEIGAAESGTALYLVEVNPHGKGPLGVVRVRFQSPATGWYEEREWLLPHRPAVPSLDNAYPSLRLAAVAAAFAEWLAQSPFAGQVTLPALQAYLQGVPEVYPLDAPPRQLATMIQQARTLSGQ